MSSEKVMIDCRVVTSRLSFLVGKTITFRNGYPDVDAVTAAQVVAVKAENTPGTEGYPIVYIYTSVGIRHITHSSEFKDIMVLEPDGLKCLGEYADNVGICF
jgi:hypothetical protein